MRKFGTADYADYADYCDFWFGDFEPRITHPDMVGTSDDVGLRGFFYRQGRQERQEFWPQNLSRLIGTSVPTFFQARRMARRELHEHVNITVRPEIVVQEGAEKGKPREFGGSGANLSVPV